MHVFELDRIESIHSLSTCRGSIIAWVSPRLRKPRPCTYIWADLDVVRPHLSLPHLGGTLVSDSLVLVGCELVVDGSLIHGVVGGGVNGTADLFADTLK